EHGEPARLPTGSGQGPGTGGARASGSRGARWSLLRLLGRPEPPPRAGHGRIAARRRAHGRALRLQSRPGGDVSAGGADGRGNQEEAPPRGAPSRVVSCLPGSPGRGAERRASGGPGRARATARRTGRGALDGGGGAGRGEDVWGGGEGGGPAPPRGRRRAACVGRL